MKYSIAIAGLAGVGLVTALIVITSIDSDQLKPIGVSLRPEATFKVPEDEPFDLLDARLQPTRSGSLLSGELFDLRPRDSDAMPPGDVLDIQIPQRAAQLREREISQAAAGTADRPRFGLLQGQKRQYIATLDAGGKVNIRATLLADRLDFFTLPGSATMLLDSGESSGDKGSSAILMQQGFISGDEGRSWRFDAAQLVPHSFIVNGFVSQTDGFQLYDDEFFVTRDASKTWQSFDIMAAVWKDTPEQAGIDRRFEWILLPASQGMAVGWSTRWERPAQAANRPEAAWKAGLTRRFEVDFETGKPVAIRQVATASDIDKVPEAPPHTLLRAPDGSVTWKTANQLRYLDPATWRWSPPVAPPPIGDVQSTFDAVWVGDKVWIVKAHGNTLWNRVACWIPPHFSDTRNCDGFSAQNYFVSRDRGRSWTPFFLEGTPSASDAYERRILGWDAQTRKLAVFHRPRSLRDRAAVELYDLPSAAGQAQ